MMKKKGLLYEQIANAIEQQICADILKTGNKLPSLRTICGEYGVSMNTALQAYYTLEGRGLIETRPRSGYVVSFNPKFILPTPLTSRPVLIDGKENKEEMIEALTLNRDHIRVPFSSGMIDLELLPVAKLNKAVVQATRGLPDSGVGYDHNGNDRLKLEIAKRSLHWGGKLKADNIITTSGCLEAICFCIMALAGRGDTIVVESPTYFGIFQLAKSIGLKVIELPTNATTGVEIEALKKVLKTRKVNLCLLVSNFNNPVGSCMPDEHKKEVVGLMEKYNIPLIEDDLYGDLYLGDHRPKTCKTFDESGIVLWCGSFSKTLAPGYRVGWVAPGKFKTQVQRTKHYHSVASNTLTHDAVGYFLENDRYENHLKKLRQTLRANLIQNLRCISACFPPGTRVSHPLGGFQLWIELDKRIDTLRLYDKAMQHQVSIAPGTLYTLQKQYGHCFRLSFGLKWSDKIEAALKLLGSLATDELKRP